MKSGKGMSAMLSATVGRARRKAGVAKEASDGVGLVFGAAESGIEVMVLVPAGFLVGTDTDAAGFAASAAAAASAQEVRRVSGLPPSSG